MLSIARHIIIMTMIKKKILTLAILCVQVQDIHILMYVYIRKSKQWVRNFFFYFPTVLQLGIYLYGVRFTFYSTVSSMEF